MSPAQREAIARYGARWRARAFSDEAAHNDIDLHEGNFYVGGRGCHHLESAREVGERRVARRIR